LKTPPHAPPELTDGGALAGIAALESSGNRRTQPLGALYEGHRRRVTATLLESAPAGGGRLCLLGAGNCNDVDLPALAARYDEIHLADIDRSAVDRTIQRQEPSIRRQLRPVAPVDLSGMLEPLSAWRDDPPTLAEIERRAASAHERVVDGLPGPFEVVASTCLLTQISWAADHLLGLQHPMLGPARDALLGTHLRALASLTASGGSALVFSDLLSSRTYPLDALAEGADLAVVVRQAAAAGNFYPGANPHLLRRLPRRDDFLAQRIDAGEWLAPWLWHGPADRIYLVLAIRFRRR
jgi:hypothetical protein